MMVNPTTLQRGLKRCRRTADTPFSGLLMSRWRLSTRLNTRAGRAGASAAAALPEQTATCCARRSVARQARAAANAAAGAEVQEGAPIRREGALEPGVPRVEDKAELGVTNDAPQCSVGRIEDRSRPVGQLFPARK